MDAVRYNLNKKQLALHKVEIPKDLQPHEVLVEVAYSGVCGTDLHIMDGEFPVKPDGVTLGHEFSGIIHQAGSDVKHLKKGDRVAVDPNFGCGCCHHCGSGNYHRCEDREPTGALGTLSDGGWATFCRLPGVQVFKLPDDIPLELGALTEPMSCLCHGLNRLGPVPMGSNVLVLGAGIIGILWVNAFHLQGHRRITVSETSPSRRSLVEGLGLGVEVVTPDELVALCSSTNKKFKVVVDCSGNAKAMEGAMNLLETGGTFVVFGLAPPNAKMFISPYSLFRHELKIIGVFTNRFTFPTSMGFIESLGRRYLDYNKIGAKLFHLDQYEDAIREIRERSISKAIFKIK